MCSGCSKCTCSAEGKWLCDNISECPDAENLHDIDDQDIDRALMILQDELKKKEFKEKSVSKFPHVPEPENNDDLLLEQREFNMEDEILALMRSKRSVDQDDKENGTVKFYHTVDELDEDTLKQHNDSGTIPVQKHDTLPQISRRSSILNSTTKSLQIEYTQPKELNHHDDNKIDTPAIHDDRLDLLVHGNFDVRRNHSQVDKDKNLSKILVNELKAGEETIGDKNAPVISNITFTPENDTLVAMTFIAGNLLNKLWNMEKDTDEDETEKRKREKIADLLDLFKEPLNMRKEMFLKNALQQLSTALNKNENVENVTLCKDIKDIQKVFARKQAEETNNDETETEHKQQIKDNTEALVRIHNVLDLINKYENVQNSLNLVKSGLNHDVNVETRNKELNKLSKNEKSSLDLYGNTLETITKLIVPNKKNKKLVKSLKNSYLFTTGNDLKKKLSELKLENMNVTTKDKIVLDYLVHIQNNPECLLKKQKDKVSLPLVEGNILLNLSEFFKIKSLSDLVTLIGTEKPVLQVTTEKNVEHQTTRTLTIENNTKKFEDTKEKLKSHLKSVLEDLIELQTGEGKKSQDIKIINALPCIYNLLNDGKETIKENKNSISRTTTKPPQKLQTIFANLKNELKVAQTRRANIGIGPRPKSAVVWERIIKNAGEKQYLQNRRSLDEAPKTINELKVIMENIDSAGSNTYKNYAYLNEVPPADRLILLKTLNADTDNHIKALKEIRRSLQEKNTIPYEMFDEFNEFLGNVETSVNLNEKVIKNLDAPKKSNKEFAINPRNRLRHKAEMKLEQPVRESSPYDSLTREQIINQLIKNRILLYVQTKEATGEMDDINYNIAKSILLHFTLGNIEVAKELYKVFNAKQENATNIKNKDIDVTRERNLQNKRQISRRRPLRIEPLIKFEEPKEVDTNDFNQDHFIKQLLKNKKF